jgi:hypothetical protein
MRKKSYSYKKSIDQFNPMRQNWILQQCLKTLFVEESDLPVLIIDSGHFREFRHQLYWTKCTVVVRRKRLSLSVQSPHQQILKR